MAGEVIPPGADNSPAPMLTARDRLDWSDFLPFVEALDHTLADPGSPVDVKIARALNWTTLVGQSSFEKLRGPRIRELIGLLMEAARIEIPARPEKMEEPSRLGQLYFRTAAAQYARKDTVADLSAGPWGRWRLFREKATSHRCSQVSNRCHSRRWKFRSVHWMLTPKRF